MKGAIGFNGFLDLAFLFMEEIWHDVQKGYGSIISSVSSQTLAVPPANNYMVDMWPNIWFNNSKAIFFLDGNFFVFDISLNSPKNECFLCALCVNVTAFFFQSTKCKTHCGINKYVPNSLT